MYGNNILYWLNIILSPKSSQITIFTHNLSTGSCQQNFDSYFVSDIMRLAKISACQISLLEKK